MFSLFLSCTCKRKGQCVFVMYFRFLTHVTELRAVFLNLFHSKEPFFAWKISGEPLNAFKVFNGTPWPPKSYKSRCNQLALWKIVNFIPRDVNISLLINILWEIRWIYSLKISSMNVAQPLEFLKEPKGFQDLNWETLA